MRRTRRLTTGERWELGLFLSMLIVACLCVTAILNIPGVPKLFAAAFGNPDAKEAMASAPTPIEIAAGPVTPMVAPVAVAQDAVSIPTHAVELPLPAVEKQPNVLPALPKAAQKKGPEIKVFGGKKYTYVKTLKLRVTAYSPDSRCCWPYPGTTTASGLSVKTNRGRLVAADTRLIPMHALVTVPGYAGGNGVPVLDRGGAIKGYRMDVLMPTFEQAKEWGSRVLEVKIYMPVEG